MIKVGIMRYQFGISLVSLRGIILVSFRGIILPLYIGQMIPDTMILILKMIPNLQVR